ncbi:MAG: VWA domain-containing protein [Micavibrio sp.]|nr:VWA domain-containing protein [Micavibrio sp.]
MDEQQLLKTLNTIKAPAPADERRRQAMNAAMEAFDKNFDIDTQDIADAQRLTDMKPKNNVRRFFMNKPRYLTGPVGAVALCALVAVLGAPFFTHQMELIGGKEEKLAATTNVKDTSGVRVEGIQMQSSNAPVDGMAAAADAQLTAKTQQQNDEAAKAATKTATKTDSTAMKTDSTAMPVILGNSQQDKLDAGLVQNGTVAPAPQAIQQPKGDSLQEWRSKAEARRLTTNEQAPPPEERQQLMQSSDAAAAPKAMLAPAPAEKGIWTPMSGGRIAGEGTVENSAELKKSKDRRDNLAPMADKEVAAGAAGRIMAVAPTDMPVPVPEPVPVQSIPAPAIPAPGVMPAPYAPPVDYGRANIMAQSGDSFPDYQDNAAQSTAQDPVSTFSIDVDTSSYSFIRKLINEGTLPPKGAVRLEEMINYFPYSYALPAKGEDPFKPTVAVYQAPWNAEHKLVHIGIKGYDLETRPPSNLVFLIDTSGSMNSPDKLPLLVSSFKLMLDSLKPDDSVAIVTYAGNAGVALPPTKVADKAKIADVLDRLYSGGSTAGADGIRTAYDLAKQSFVKEGNNRVILATDGDFNVGLSGTDELKTFIEKKRNEGISLSVLGFGQGNYHDSTMQVLAQNGNGNAAYIDNLNEARKVLVEEAGSTLFTIAKDVKIQVEFNPALVQEYRLIGYETRHLNREDFNNDKIDAGEVGAGHAVTAIYEITPVGAKPVSDPLRYSAKEKALPVDTDKKDGGNEYAFLKIRFKQPDGDTSKLMTRPITPSDDKKFADLPDDLRFAAAVAGFGQVLRGSAYTNGLTYDQIIDMANNARGKDEFGYRSEFVNLVRLAKSESATGQ